MNKILITGGGGVLAGYVADSLRGNHVYAPSHKELDITNKKLLEKTFNDYKPDIAIHLAAKTNVDLCEKNPEETFLVNSEATKNIAQLCKKHNSLLVFMSTAAVFNGNKKIFYEDDERNPINIYGKSKLLGEKYVQEILRKYIIVRSGWLIGGAKKEKKFVSYIIDLIKKKKEIFVVDDIRGTVTYAAEIANTIKTLIEEDGRGIYHFGSKGSCTRFELANEIVKLTNSKTKLIPVNSDYFKNSFFAPRLKNEIIGSTKLKYLHTWKESLKTYYDLEIKNSL
jgi:dTDP-4-dehydrorhamnose reductase